MTGGVVVSNGVVVGVAIPIEGLRVAWVGYNGVCRNETPGRGVIVTSPIIEQTEVFFALTGEAEIGGMRTGTMDSLGLGGSHR